MNQLIPFEFSEFSILWIVVLGLILSLFFRLLRRLVVQKYVQNSNIYIYDLLEIAIWVIFGLVAIKVVLRDSLYYMLAVLSIFAIILVWFGWFVARDFIAGLVLKFGGNFQAGQQFNMDDIKGNIVSANHLYLNVLQSNGLVTKIPYHKISESIHSEAQPGDQSSEFRFEIDVSNDLNLEVQQSRIRSAILLTPGVAVNKEPKIHLKARDDKNSTFEIIAYLIHIDYSGNVLSNIKKIIG
jgi:small-conductance mechanosensitive channel